MRVNAFTTVVVSALLDDALSEISALIDVLREIDPDHDPRAKDVTDQIVAFIEASRAYRLAMLEGKPKFQA